MIVHGFTDGGGAVANGHHLSLIESFAFWLHPEEQVRQLDCTLTVQTAAPRHFDRTFRHLGIARPISGSRARHHAVSQRQSGTQPTDP